jgi:allophanate hydrolase
MRRYRVGETSPGQVLANLVKLADAYADPAVWIHRIPAAELLARAREINDQLTGGTNLPLYGLPFAVKDSIDVAGMPTTAGCSAYAYVPEQSAPAVQRLLNAGAICFGKTNLDQFGTGLAGDRSPYGACRNVFHREYISGGSSSGSAVAVAAGLVSFALGTDTAGSGRVPAGCNNIVGLKPTPGALSTTGVVPSCRSLDCVSILALTVEDACKVFQVAKEKSSNPPASIRQPAWYSFAVPRDEDLEFYGDNDQARLFQVAIGRLEQCGVRRSTVDFRPFREVAALLYEGPWVAERLAAIGDFLRKQPDDVLPVTRGIIEGGARFTAVDVFRALDQLKALRGKCLEVFDQAEVLVVPTMPALPTLADVQADSIGWSRRLGFYTNFVNLLQLAAVAIPAGFTARGLPGGITLIGPGSSEDRLCALGTQWQQRLRLPLGATGQSLPPAEFLPEPTNGALPEGYVRLAVAGAHLRRQPLHDALCRTGARFVRACRTAPGYRFVALLDLSPPRPGLVRDDHGTGSIAVEIYDLPVAGFGSLVASVAPPLAIGTICLEDGEAVKGFLCESWAADRARDITEFGGWIAFRDHWERRIPAGAAEGS